MLFHPLWGIPIVILGSIISHLSTKEKIWHITVPYYTTLFGFFTVVVGMMIILGDSTTYLLAAMAIGVCLAFNPYLEIPDTVGLIGFALFTAGLLNAGRFCENRPRHKNYYRVYHATRSRSSHHNICTKNCSRSRGCHH